MWGFSSSKPKEPAPKVYSGFMGDCSEEQTKVMIEIREWFNEQGYNPVGAFDDYDVLRFCRARKFVVADIQAMVVKNQEWRQSEKIDDYLETFKFDEVNQVKDVYPHGYHGVDKIGRPIYIERIGVLQMDKLWQVTTEAQMIGHFIHEYEKLLKWRFPACSAVYGDKIQQGLTIIDLTGGGASLVFNKQVKNLLQIAAQVGSDNYPEIMGKMVVINAPYLFSGMWSIIKGFLDERTRAKIQILSNNGKDLLLELCEADQLPQFLGGTCTCADRGGDCLRSDVGPWLDYKMVEPFGVERITESPKIEEIKEESQEEKKEE